jgi:hypothetical protein
MAATWDVFGNGKTALKANAGKYLEATITASNYGIANPTSRIVSSVSRTWTDANGNFTPDCNVLNPAAQDLRGSGGDFCGEDLRPATYTVTFTLQGFSTYKREGIELTGSFIATINAELKVGTLAETITVSGETPVVDVQSAKRETTLSNEVVRDIPNVPGVQLHGRPGARRDHQHE